MTPPLFSNFCLLLAFLTITANCYILPSPHQSMENQSGGEMFGPMVWSSMGGGSRGGKMVKRRPEMNARGFNGDSLSGGFGDFYTMKRSSARSDTIEAKLDYLIDLISSKEE
eukprot:TRINITY_DN1736_c0_g1_i2.p1 TRINITY_DN1736_c0_g1~~TRINITY_DN1736_c0_g1_i2.p1  ORF type:complete len:112 (+),score=28.89 TRINITY_DN1736_c0_g1_i2:104-439(+)